MGINLSNFLSSKSKSKRMMEFQDLDHIDGVSISAVSANLYNSPRDDLVMLYFRDGANYASVYTQSKIISEKGPINILINNAANDERHAIDDVTEEYWNERMNINLRHYFFTVQSVKKAMIKNKGGAIVNIGSASWMVGQGGMAAYTAAKSGVVGLTRSFARDLGEFNIRVNSVVPGWTMTERQIEKWLTPESEKDLMKNQCLKRKLMPSDIAKAVLFFSSEQSSGCTNQSYVVDNGWL